MTDRLMFTASSLPIPSYDCIWLGIGHSDSTLAPNVKNTLLFIDAPHASL